MTRTVLGFVLASVLVAAGCDDGGPDHAALPDEPTSRVEQPQPTPTPSVPPLHPSVDGYPEARVTVGGVEIVVKLADDADRRAHGLMEVEYLPDGTGMLFAFEQERTGGFWMKDTLVPLDIAYVDAAGGIVSILSMQPCAADPCEVYDPGTAYQVALEVPQGWFDEMGVEVGDTLDWEPLDD